MPRKKKTSAVLIDTSKLTPLSPVAAAQQVTRLKDLYETTELDSSTYDAARLQIFRRLALWTKEGQAK